MLIALSVLAMATVTLASGLRVKRSSATRHARRVQIIRLFARFASANLEARATPPLVERFLEDTADTAALFPIGTMPLLRLELYDQAVRLGRLSASLDEDGLGVGRRPAIIEGCEEKRAWFEQVGASLEALLAAEIDTVPDLRDLCSEGMRLFNRAIRA